MLSPLSHSNAKMNKQRSSDTSTNETIESPIHSKGMPINIINSSCAESHGQQPATTGQATSRSLSSSFSDLGDLSESFSESYSSTPGKSSFFNSIRETEHDQKSPQERQGSSEAEDHPYHYPLLDRKGGVMPLAGERVQLRVDKVAYIIFYTASEEEEEEHEAEDIISLSPRMSLSNPQEQQRYSLIENVESEARQSFVETPEPTSSDISSSHLMTQHSNPTMLQSSCQSRKQMASMGAAGHRVTTANRFQREGLGVPSQSLGRGLMRASTSVGQSLLKGASGLVSHTVAGTHQGGIFGFAKGLSLGMFGLGSHAVKGALSGVSHVTDVMGQILLGQDPHMSLEGSMVLTNFRILWTSQTTEDVLTIPLASIVHLESGAVAPHVLNVTCKHLMRPCFAFEDESLCYNVIQCVHDIYIAEPRYVFARAYATAMKSSEQRDSANTTSEEVEAAEEEMGLKPKEPFQQEEETEQGDSANTTSEEVEEEMSLKQEKETEEVQEPQPKYSPEADYARMGLLECPHLRLLDNNSWLIFPSYPPTFVIPASLSTLELSELANYRSSSRIPAVVWIHPQTKATMSRCAQPCVGLSGYVDPVDQKVVECLRLGSNPPLEQAQEPEFVFIDARSNIAATANSAHGKGTEDVRNYKSSRLHFCNIANIHAVRASYANLALVCQSSQNHQHLRHLALAQDQDQDLSKEESLDRASSSSSNSSSVNDQNKVEENSAELQDWLNHINSILAAVLECTSCLMNGASIMVHCSDGWDRTPAITALVELVLDGHYRTLVGFCALVEKEWCSFGHLFRSRFGHGDAPGEQEVEEQSPVFIQWLDAVWQIWRQCPWAFEFNERLLEEIYEAAFSGVFGTFLYNCPKERLELERNEVDEGQQPPLCLWDALLQRKNVFMNEGVYDAPSSKAHHGQVLPCNPDLQTLQLWKTHVTIADPICSKYC